MQLILMGAPGAGKGTQAAKLVERYKIPQISTGEMFRAALAQGSELGKRAAEYMRAGQLVPDEVTIGIVKERIGQADCEGGFILDGFPRTVVQAEELNKILKEQGKELTRVLNVQVEREELIERAVGRRICKKCGATYHVRFKGTKEEGKCDECGGELYQRLDDTAETMKKRLQVYEESTRPLIEYYKRAGKYSEISGSQPIEKVTEDLINVLTSVNS